MSRAMRTVFVFQAEDGIRDLVRSRGLGDVYKRQVHRPDRQPDPGAIHRFGGGGGGVQGVVVGQGRAPVSYTHLTLPTSDLV